MLKRTSGHRGANLIKGVVALQANDADEVIRRARTALREDPTWLPALRLLADGHLKKGEQELAIEALKGVLAADPGDSNAAARLATLLTQKGDLDGALKIWDEVLQRASDPAPALQARAALAIRQGNWIAAQADIDRLAGLQGNEPAAAVLSGNLNLAQRQFDQGREWFLKAETLRPDASDPVLGVVNSYVAENKLDDAIAYLKQRVEAKPTDAVAYQLTAELLVRGQKPQEAVAAYREAIKLQPTWLAPYRQLGTLLVRSGDTEGAAEVYEAGYAAVPEAVGLLLDQGSAHVVAGDNDAALKSFDRVLERDPKNEVAANNVAALIADYKYEDKAAARAWRWRWPTGSAPARTPTSSTRWAGCSTARATTRSRWRSCSARGRRAPPARSSIIIWAWRSTATGRRRRRWRSWRRPPPRVRTIRASPRRGRPMPSCRPSSARTPRVRAPAEPPYDCARSPPSAWCCCWAARAACRPTGRGVRSAAC